jgi:hypothetical protein
VLETADVRPTAQSAFEREILSCGREPIDFGEHETGGAQRCALGRERGKARGDEVGVDKVDRACIACQIFARECRLAGAAIMRDAGWP